MDHTTVILVIAALGAFFMAFNNGANDVANAFASAVGSKAITVKQALVIAASLNLVGAVLLGSHVASTLLESVISVDVVINPEEYILGMIATLVASGTFVLFSTLTGMPVSSTHAIVGSMAGVGIMLGGWGAVNWGIFGIIGLSWVVSPFLAGMLSWICIRVIRKNIYKESKRGKILSRVKNRAPVFIALSVGVLTYSVIERSHFGPDMGIVGVWKWVVTLGAVVMMYVFLRGLVGKWSRGVEGTKEGAERMFRKMQVGTSCYVAFAHGSNDVSNSISPVLAIFLVLSSGVVPRGMEPLEIPLWILLLGGVGMALGIGFLGHKVMATLGKKITLMTNSRGFSVDFATATTVVLASVMGMPVSSTHAATGSVIGVGLDRGRGGVNLGILVKILSAWIITVPCAALLTMLVYTVLKWVLLGVFSG